MVGVHGYNPSYSAMKPIFFARGPAFKSGNYRAKSKFLTKDIYAIIGHVTGIKPNHSTDATIENAWDIFTDGQQNSSTTIFNSAATFRQFLFIFVAINVAKMFSL